eukprot:gene4240-14776_t
MTAGEGRTQEQVHDPDVPQPCPSLREGYEELGTIARCQAYTAAIFFADSAAAKELLRALDDVMPYLIDVSRVLRDQRVLDKATPRMSRCPILA